LLSKFFTLHNRIAATDPDRAEFAVRSQVDIANHLGYNEFTAFEADYAAKLKSLKLASFEDLERQYRFDSITIAASVNVQRLGNHPVSLEFTELKSIFS